MQAASYQYPPVGSGTGDSQSSLNPTRPFYWPTNVHREEHAASPGYPTAMPVIPAWPSSVGHYIPHNETAKIANVEYRHPDIVQYTASSHTHHKKMDPVTQSRKEMVREEKPAKYPRQAKRRDETESASNRHHREGRADVKHEKCVNLKVGNTHGTRNKRIRRSLSTSSTSSTASSLSSSSSSSSLSPSGDEESPTKKIRYDDTVPVSEINAEGDLQSNDETTPVVMEEEFPDPKPKPARKVKVNAKVSLNRAANNISAEIKKAGGKVVMEDDNIVVYQDTYRILYKNMSDVFKPIDSHIAEAVAKAKSALNDMMDAKMDRFCSALERETKKKLNEFKRIGQQMTTAANTKNEERHKFVIVTSKPSSDGMYHITCAIDRDEAIKKMNRMKNVEKLFLTFNEQGDVRALRSILRREGLMALKLKNDFSFKHGVTDLQTHLVGLLHRHSVAEGLGKFDVMYLAATPTVKPKGSEKSKRTTKKQDSSVKRSRSEEFTESEAEAGDQLLDESGIRVEERETDGNA